MRLKKELRAWYSPPPPISLDSTNFSVELTFNKMLEIIATLKNLILISQQIYPNKFTKVVNKAHIIRVPTYRCRSRPPHIREYEVHGTR
jgi:hypothetical protein